MSTSSSINLNSNSDEDEISKLINLLILRVECLTNENTLIDKKINYPTIKEIDENLIEYLYYLFNKFVQEEPDLTTSSTMIDKTNFVNVCQTLVRNGCFNLPTTSNSPDESLSESTITNSSDQTLPQTFVHEYRSETDDISLKQSSLTNDQETWLVVDIEPIQPKYSSKSPEQSKVRTILPSLFNKEPDLIIEAKLRPSFLSNEKPFTKHLHIYLSILSYGRVILPMQIYTEKIIIFAFRKMNKNEEDFT
jgi:hypothetical protein